MFSAADISLMCVQGFIEDVGSFFTPIREAESWEGTGYSSGAEAMSGVLELVRRHQVQILGPSKKVGSQ